MVTQSPPLPGTDLILKLRHYAKMESDSLSQLCLIMWDQACAQAERSGALCGILIDAGYSNAVQQSAEFIGIEELSENMNFQSIRESNAVDPAPPQDRAYPLGIIVLA